MLHEDKKFNWEQGTTSRDHNDAVTASSTQQSPKVDVSSNKLKEAQENAKEATDKVIEAKVWRVVVFLFVPIFYWCGISCVKFIAHEIVDIGD